MNPFKTGPSADPDKDGYNPLLYNRAASLGKLRANLSAPAEPLAGGRDLNPKTLYACRATQFVKICPSGNL